MKKNTLLIIVTIILLLIAGVSLSFYFSKRQAEKIAINKIIQETERSEKEKQDKVNYETTRLATAAKGLDSCSTLESEAKDLCIYKVTILAGIEDYCEKIERTELKENCHDKFILVKVIAQSEGLKCLTLENDLTKNECLEYFYSKINNISQCENYSSENKARCLDVVNNRIAFNNKDISGCDSITSQAMKIECKRNINNMPKDSDSDGISDSLERSYGTDPFKADTDSDGLNDLDEMSKYRTNPTNPDTDGDGISDGDAVRRGLIKAKD